MTKEVKQLFGTDGVRGKANYEPMTVELSVLLGKAVAGVLQESKSGKHRVVVGKDTRLSGYMFENALVAGLTSMGIETLVLGPIPTPGVAFITRAYRADAGIMISASHNPYWDNGIKIFSSEGFKISDVIERRIEQMVALKEFGNFPDDCAVGKNKRVVDAMGRYIEFAKATFPRGRTLKGLKIVLDCAHGAAYKVAPSVFEELDAEVICYGCEPTGSNINDNCGALFPSVIQKAVIEHKADVGIALDGDGDRVIMVDEKGHIVDGDMILSICANDLKKKDLLRGNRVIATVMTNFGVLKYLESVGIEALISPVGDRHVLQNMLEYEVNLGGEQSGHMIFLDYNTTGDGIVSALQVLRIMIESESTLSDLTSLIVKSPQALINVAVKEKIPLDTLPLVQEALRDVRSSLGDSGRVLLRYSGTENICRVMVEGLKKHQVDSLAKTIADIVDSELGVGMVE
ncbi:phosphoglucosamine mutase [Chlamydia abortus]|uniref:Phosphoglucosamine mutase n=1 Tax=Chlamydia abortus (strain DSM 27085 / S26/3) TaxID=218497 RepID=GLMM_CHLAB|nr:phosphoglucosamine mutase [Chlamydia abortus]Q5L588.1 RecName: Full=Phosphoglucosamine mutase [Chlamydia abortus S26/3]ASD30873.1 phosphoglucosamine mutase [Chlamydia abortus]AUS60237.1 phosphoglucosamine mutase [Chlamydia abortus]EGK69496.1 phosphoglucosamine mutase [Chlamydia abortus LLG]QRR31515.1 phosphoglucosamine mutase [Chlamydia abortus]CAH64204.1 putative phosphoglucomutase [Chlamydia abortus S26/3]